LEENFVFFLMSVPYGLFLPLLPVQLIVPLFEQLLNHIKHPAKHQHKKDNINRKKLLQHHR
jgi:hypothetical protein